MKRMWSKNELKNQADARVQALVEGGTLENAKPIYFHGIRISQDAGDGLYEARITLTILDNNETPYTAETLLAKIKNIMDNDGRIIANGYLIRSDSVLVNVYEIGKTTDYFIYGNSTTTRLSVNLSYLGTNFVCIDGVNKIN